LEFKPGHTPLDECAACTRPPFTLTAQSIMAAPPTANAARALTEEPIADAPDVVVVVVVDVDVVPPDVVDVVVEVLEERAYVPRQVTDSTVAATVMPESVCDKTHAMVS